MPEKEEHPLIAQYKKAHELAENYAAKLSAHIFNRGLVGKPTDEKTIDDVVNALHSGEAAKMIKEVLGPRAQGLDDQELLARYSLPKHQIKRILSNYDSITDDVLRAIANELVSRVRSELVSHHPAALANLAYEQGVGPAQKVLLDLYTLAGGEETAKKYRKGIEGLKTPEQIHSAAGEHYHTIDALLSSDASRVRKPVYDTKKAA